MRERRSVESPIKELCQALGVSRSGYYQWQQPGMSSRQAENQQLVEQIQAIHQEHRGR